MGDITMKTKYYYYDENTGEFALKTNKKYEFTDMPYILKPADWRWDQYRIDLNTGEPVEKN
jgi:hypothetical protein